MYRITRVTQRLSKSGGMLMAISLAAVVGGATTAIVSAAIPDSGGTIHGCYRNSAGLFSSKGTLRVINTDNGESCTSAETALDWSQGGPQVAYGYFVGTQPNGSDATLDINRSKNIASAQVFYDSDPMVGSYVACITATFNPKNIADTGSNRAPAAASVRTPGLDAGNNGWSGPYGSQADAACGSTGANAYIQSVGYNDFFSLYQ